jgi:hypothetical protein
VSQRVDRIEKDPKLDNIIIVTAMDGTQIRYLVGTDGIMRPGRVWQSMTPGQQHPYYTVTFFIAFPDGPPEILKVVEHQ